MLSSPVRVRGRDEAVGRGRGIAVRLEEHRRDLVLGEHVSEAVGAEEDEVAGFCGHGEDVHLDGALGSDRSRDRRALRMPLRLLGVRTPLSTSSATSEWSVVICSSPSPRSR